ncbi:MAG: hypothetical protein NHB32_14690 [Fischerella sp. CENA71]|nr:hypothetical protein [Fischerella sp. CENA71]
MASLVQKNGLGYVMRCRDYHLLEHLDVQARIKSAASRDWQTVNGNDFQKMLDIGYIEELGRGYSAPMRLIVVRTPEKLHPNRVGKSLKGEVYELFMTSQSASSLNASDVLNLYYGRGGFERRLFEEDEEQQMDRWCSWTPSE